MRNFLPVAALIFLLGACADDTQAPNIPVRLVNLEINLTNLQYQPLRQVGGYVYVEGGNRGLIVYRQSQTEFRAWDRICTYEPAKECEIVEMHESGFYMEDPCCKTTFDFEGFPASGPAKYPLVEYKAASDGTFLYISN